MWLPRGKELERGVDLEFGADRCKLLNLECRNKVLWYSTGSYIQSPRINILEKNILKTIYICI